MLSKVCWPKVSHKRGYAVLAALYTSACFGLDGITLYTLIALVYLALSIR